MKFPSRKIRCILTSAFTLPIALLMPPIANASEGTVSQPGNNPQLTIESSAVKATEAIKSSLPLISVKTSIVVTAPATAYVSFDRIAVSSSPNPEIEKARLLAVAVAEADAKKKEEEANAKKKAEEEADKQKAEAEKAFAAGDVSSLEKTGFKAGIEPMTEMDDKLVSIAATGLGKPYVWGGTTPQGWDCSGYVQWVYAQAGIKIPRVNQWEAGTITTKPVPGDIVVQNNNTHVGIYAGGGMMYSALNPDQGTRFHSVNIAPSYFVHIER